MQNKFTVDEIMSKVQEYASTWASVDGPFDTGQMLEAAMLYCEREKVDYLIVYWLVDVRFPGFDQEAFEARLKGAGTELVCCQLC